MNSCEEITLAKDCAAQLGLEWVRLATFGNQTEEKFYEMLKLFGFIKALENPCCLNEEDRSKISGQIKLICSNCN